MPSLHSAVALATALSLFISAGAEADTLLRHEEARPIIRQQADASCGLAAVASLLHWAGRPMSEQDLYARLGAVLRWNARDRDVMNDRGLAVRDLLALIADLGLQPHASRRTPARVHKLAQQDPVLVLLRIGDDPSESGHFAIVEHAFDDGGVAIADPAFGRYRLTREEFALRFAGAADAGISLVVRSPSGAPLVGPQDRNGEGLRVLPSLEERLLQFARAQLPAGKTSIDADLRWSRTSPVALTASEGSRLVGRQQSSVASIGFRHGVTDDLEVALQVPFGMARDSLRLETPEGSHEFVTRSGHGGDEATIGASWIAGRSEDGNWRHAITAGATIRRPTGLAGYSVGWTTTWYPPTGPFAEVGAGLLAWQGRNGDPAQVTASGTAMVPIGDRVRATFAFSTTRVSRDGTPGSRAFQSGLEVAWKMWAIRPYLLWQRQAGLREHGAGLAMTVQLPRSLR